MLIATGVALAWPVHAANQAKQSARDAGRILVIQVNSDSVDFRLVDPDGRIAVIAVDSAMSAIPDCDSEKHSWFQDHDDSAWDPDSVEAAPYGGGTFSLVDPAAGEWKLEAIASRGCLDSCEVTGLFWEAGTKQMNVNEEIRRVLLAGEAATWKIELAPRAVRPSRTWAKITLERVGTLKR